MTQAFMMISVCIQIVQQVVSTLMATVLMTDPILSNTLSLHQKFKPSESLSGLPKSMVNTSTAEL